jgi:uncharacterized membrane protein YjjP (DUF1212 family)
MSTDVILHYEDANYRYANAQINAIGNQMRANLQQAIANSAVTEDIERKTVDLEDAARRFQKKSKKLRCKECFNYYKMWFLLLMLLILFVIALVIVLTK